MGQESFRRKSYLLSYLKCSAFKRMQWFIAYILGIEQVLQTSSWKRNPSQNTIIYFTFSVYLFKRISRWCNHISVSLPNYQLYLCFPIKLLYTFSFSSLCCAIYIIYRNTILGTSIHCFQTARVGLLHLVRFPITCIHFTNVQALTFSVMFYSSFFLAVLKFCFWRDFHAKRQCSFNLPQVK